MNWKKIGKVAITVLATATSPIWILPFVLGIAIVFVGAGLHQAIWGVEK